MALSGDYLTKLKENLTCPLCYEVYNYEERTPKALPCIHTLCLQCLDSYVKKNLEENHLCPLCQAKFEVREGGVKSVPTNTGLKSMLDLLPPEVPTDDNIPSKHVVDAECSREDSVDNVIPPKLLCKQHGSAECSFICMDCKVLLCNQCITSLNHGTHSLKDAEAAKATLNVDAKATISRFADIAKKHDDHVANILAKSLAWKTSLNDQIAQEVDNATKNMKLWQQDVNTEVEVEYNDAIKDAKDMKDTFSKEKQEIEPLISKLVEMSDNNDINAYELMATINKNNYFLDLNREEEIINMVPSATFKGTWFPIDLGHMKEHTVKMYFTINDVKTFGKQKVKSRIYSQNWYLHKLPWKIGAELEKEKRSKWLCVAVQCDGNMGYCHYKMKVELCVLNFKGDELSLTFDKKCWVFHKNQIYFAVRYEEYPWHKLIDPELGFVKNNCMTIMATLTDLEAHLE